MSGHPLQGCDPGSSRPNCPSRFRRLEAAAGRAQYGMSLRSPIQAIGNTRTLRPHGPLQIAGMIPPAPRHSTLKAAERPKPSPAQMQRPEQQIHVVRIRPNRFAFSTMIRSASATNRSSLIFSASDIAPSLFFSSSSSRCRCFAAGNFFSFGGDVLFMGQIIRIERTQVEMRYKRHYIRVQRELQCSAESLGEELLQLSSVLPLYRNSFPLY